MAIQVIMKKKGNEREEVGFQILYLIELSNLKHFVQMSPPTSPNLS